LQLSPKGASDASPCKLPISHFSTDATQRRWSMVQSAQPVRRAGVEQHRRAPVTQLQSLVTGSHIAFTLDIKCP
jgi:hypothetical protein